MKTFIGEPWYVTVELVNRNCNVLRMLKNLGIKDYSFVDVRTAQRGLTRHLVKFPVSQIDKVSKDASIKVHKGGSIGEATAWYDTYGCDVCRAILSNDSFLVSARKTKDDTIVHSFVAPDHDSFKKIMSILEENDFKPNILEAGKFEPKTKRLTEKQEKILWFALKMGFFDYPRRIGLSELSNKLGVSPSSLSEMSRRGIRRLLEEHFQP